MSVKKIDAGLGRGAETTVIEAYQTVHTEENKTTGKTDESSESFHYLPGRESRGLFIYR